LLILMDIDERERGRERGREGGSEQKQKYQKLE
jgi:hypothetical protein